MCVFIYISFRLPRYSSHPIAISNNMQHFFRWTIAPFARRITVESPRYLMGSQNENHWFFSWLRIPLFGNHSLVLQTLHFLRSGQCFLQNGLPHKKARSIWLLGRRQWPQLSKMFMGSTYHIGSNLMSELYTQRGVSGLAQGERTDVGCQTTLQSDTFAWSMPKAKIKVRSSISSNRTHARQDLAGSVGDLDNYICSRLKALPLAGRPNPHALVHAIGLRYRKSNLFLRAFE